MYLLLHEQLSLFLLGVRVRIRKQCVWRLLTDPPVFAHLSGCLPVNLAGLQGCGERSVNHYESRYDLAISDPCRVGTTLRLSTGGPPRNLPLLHPPLPAHAQGGPLQLPVA